MNVALVIGVTSVVAALAAAFFAYRALFPPKREIDITVFPPAPLLAAENVTVSGISVSRHGRELVDPHVVTVSISNAGRHDVTAASFHQGVPLVVDLGAPVEVVQVTEEPERATPLPCVADGEELRVGPGLISRGQKVHILLLTEGMPAVDPLHVRHDLVDVALNRTSTRKRRVKALATLSVLAVVTSVGALVAALVLARLTSPIDDPRVYTLNTVDRGGGTAIFGDNLPEFCPVEIRMFQRVVGRGQTDETGSFVVSVRVAQDAPLGKTTVLVSCRDAQRAADYSTTIAVIRPSESPTSTPSH